MRDLVVASERPQGLSGCAATNERRVGDEAAEAITVRFGGGCGGVVVRECAYEDRRVEPEHVLAAAQAGRLDDRLDPPAGGDDCGGGIVALAVQLGAGQRPGGIALVQPGRIGAARNRPAASDLGTGGSGVAGLRAFERGLLSRPPAHLLLPLPLGRPLRSRRPLLGPQQPGLLPDLARDLRAGEVAAERRMPDPYS
ncbi:MAG: hypothetical protein ACRDNP_01505 [Gaiellaceae bacterium]